MCEGPERRAESRQSTKGVVQLRQAGLPEGPFQGCLMDTAAHGFRARHCRLSIASGQLVEFEGEERRGIARVVWTRIVDGEAETGFYVVA